VTGEIRMMLCCLYGSMMKKTKVCSDLEEKEQILYENADLFTRYDSGVRTKSWTLNGLRKELNQHVFAGTN
jgi:hypothetical protein